MHFGAALVYRGKYSDQKSMFRIQRDLHTLLTCDFSVSFQDDWLRVVCFNRIILLRFAIWCQRFSLGLIRLNVPFLNHSKRWTPKGERSSKIQFFSGTEQVLLKHFPVFCSINSWFYFNKMPQPSLMKGSSTAWGHCRQVWCVWGVGWRFVPHILLHSWSHLTVKAFPASQLGHYAFTKRQTRCRGVLIYTSALQYLVFVCR